MRSCIESLWSNSALARSVQFSSLPTSASIFLINRSTAPRRNSPTINKSKRFSATSCTKSPANIPPKTNNLILPLFLKNFSIFSRDTGDAFTSKFLKARMYGKIWESSKPFWRFFKNPKAFKNPASFETAWREIFKILAASFVVKTFSGESRKNRKSLTLAALPKSFSKMFISTILAV
ncbi:hypothetical protein A2120_01845 [Candidatus Giovannonibacteria bacterium GWA2_45_15]|nr:MAG: hypothetical protein A2120_01845 [Candidatus Giovannonibacteria bacterium GWA2_45_15]